MYLLENSTDKLKQYRLKSLTHDKISKQESILQHVRHFFLLILVFRNILKCKIGRKEMERSISVEMVVS